MDRDLKTDWIVYVQNAAINNNSELQKDRFFSKAEVIQSSSQA